MQLETYAQALVTYMPATDILNWSRHNFIAIADFGPFTSWGDMLALIEAVESHVKAVAPTLAHNLNQKAA